MSNDSHSSGAAVCSLPKSAVPWWAAKAAAFSYSSNTTILILSLCSRLTRYWVSGATYGLGTGLVRRRSALGDGGQELQELVSLGLAFGNQTASGGGTYVATMIKDPSLGGSNMVVGKAGKRPRRRPTPVRCRAVQ